MRKAGQTKKQQIIVPLDFDETFEWCNSFMLIPKVNGKARLCSDLAWLNKVLVMAIHRASTISKILPRLTCVKYLTLTDMSSRSHNLKVR